MSTKANFPFDGQLYPSSAKKFPELVFFVHFFEGDRKSMAKHIQLVNGLGYDAFAFTLAQPTLKNPVPLSPHGKIGWKHYYAEQIESLLNLLAGPKIVFAFSNPAAGAIEALARRNCHDVKALICDSGPSSKFILSGFRLAGKYMKEKKFLRAIYTSSIIWTWSLDFNSDLGAQLNRFPSRFPILSIRGWKDELVSPDEIDHVFEPHQQLAWQKLSLPEAHHVDGLKLFPTEYKLGVENFLKQVRR